VPSTNAKTSSTRTSCQISSMTAPLITHPTPVLDGSGHRV
jgi:hypothetical protein